MTSDESERYRVAELAAQATARIIEDKERSSTPYVPAEIGNAVAEAVSAAWLKTKERINTSAKIDGAATQSPAEAKRAADLRNESAAMQWKQTISAQALDGINKLHALMPFDAAEFASLERRRAAFALKSELEKAAQDGLSALIQPTSGDKTIATKEQLAASDAEINALKWKLSVFSKQSNAAQPAPEVPLFVLGPFRLVRLGQAIRFHIGTWLTLGLSWGDPKQAPQSTREE